MDKREFKKSESFLVLTILLVIFIILTFMSILNLGNSTSIFNKIEEARLHNEYIVQDALNTHQLKSGDRYIRTSPFSYVITGDLKKYIERKIGRNLESTDYFYEIETEKLTISNENKYIFSSKLNTVIEISSKDMKDIKQPKAVWLKINLGLPEEAKYIDKHADTVSVLDKLKGSGINCIYLSIDMNDVSRYSNFIKEAYKKDMYVYAMYDDPNYIFENNYITSINNNMKAISQYNKFANYDEKIRGIHYSVKPYENKDKWQEGQSEAAKNNICRTSYINFVIQSQKYANTLGLIVGFDIPVWLDRYTVIHNGEEKNMAEEVVNNADEVTLLDYATTAEGIYSNLDNRGTYTFPDNTTITVDQSILQRLDLNKKNYIIAIDLNTLKQESQNNVNKAITPTSNVEYTDSYISKMLLDVESKVNVFEQNNNMNSQFGFGYNDAFELLRLKNFIK